MQVACFILQSFVFHIPHNIKHIHITFCHAPAP
jgi:hypothetical protein